MAVDFAKIKTDLTALKTAVEGGSLEGFCHAFGDVWHDAGEVAAVFKTSGPMSKTQKADPLVADCVCCCDEIEAALPAILAALPPPTMSAGQVGAIGDGSLLKMILAALPDLLAIFRKFFSGS